MANLHSFNQLMRTAILLVFALSFNALNVQASQNSTYTGSDFLNKENTHVVQNPSLHKPVVKGYAIKIATDCPSPYHVQTDDGRCVWSCSVGTTPSTTTNECECQSGYTQTGTDSFGRRVCSISTVTCADTDNGLDTNTQGTTSGLNVNGQQVTWTDVCTTDSAGTIEAESGSYAYVTEYYCNNNVVTPWYGKTCQWGCRQGRCLNVPTSTPPYPDVCTGHGLPVSYAPAGQQCCAGLTTQMADGIKDYCMPPEPITTQNPCRDSDAGTTSTIWGKVTGGSYGTIGYNHGPFADYCNPYNGKVVEYFCSGDYIQFNEITCSTGMSCSYGACRTSTSTTPVSDQCAQAGLRADIYGGPNHVCCAGLVLEGGVCNVPQATSVDFIVTDLKIEQRTGDVGKYVYITVKNIGAPVTENGHILSVKIEDLDTTDTYFSGTTEPYPSGWTKEIPTGTTILPKTSGIYRLKATVDNVGLFTESNENNNTFEKTITTSQTSSRQVIICHKTGNDAYVEIQTDTNGWLNGHSKHEGDYIKSGFASCGKSSTPTEPIRITPPKKPLEPIVANSDSELIRQLRERIQKLEIKISELEKSVTEREQERETKVNQKLTQSLKGRMLLQVQQKGEVWFIGYDGKKYYLANGDTAYQILKAFGTGITETDFAKLSQEKSTPFGKSHAGQIFLRVQSKGEAYYITKEGVAIYLKDGDAAYEAMRKYSLGATDTTLSQLDTGSLEVQQ